MKVDVYANPSDPHSWVLVAHGDPPQPERFDGWRLEKTVETGGGRAAGFDWRAAERAIMVDGDYETRRNLRVDERTRDE